MKKFEHEVQDKVEGFRHRIVLRPTFPTGLSIEGPWAGYRDVAVLVDEGQTYVAFCDESQHSDLPLNEVFMLSRVLCQPKREG